MSGRLATLFGRRHSRRQFLAGSAAAALGLGLWSCAPTPQAPQPAPAQPAEQPRYGGELVFAVEAEPPSLDAHRETTFALRLSSRPRG